MIYVGSCFAQLSLIGRMKGIFLTLPYKFTVIIIFSVRAKLCACEPGFDITSSFFIRVLYKSFKGTTDDYELGFLQSSLLVKVRHILLLLMSLSNPIQVYKHIFTSPTSAKDGSITLSDVENDLPAP